MATETVGLATTAPDPNRDRNGRARNVV